MLEKYTSVNMKISEQGTVKVCENSALKENCLVEVIRVDLESKHADVMIRCENPDIPSVSLFKTQDTLFVDMDSQQEFTTLEFPDYKGWRVLECYVNRYTLTVILIKERG